MQKKIIIAGGSGFIGKPLCSLLTNAGYDVFVLTRSPESASKALGNSAAPLLWDAKTSGGWAREAEGALAIVNLAGESVASGRWTASKRHEILGSRLNAARAVMDAIDHAKKKPALLVQASAVGFYGSSLVDRVLDENSPAGSGFLARVARQWEKATENAESLGTRRAVIRTGIVLGDGGALKKMVLPYRFFAGGHFGTGMQYLSWIHIEDEIEAIRFIIERKMKGFFNLTAPEPVTAGEFSKTLGMVTGRPAWLNIPSWAVKLVFGRMGAEALLLGQRAVPAALAGAGFRFKYPRLEGALRDLL